MTACSESQQQVLFVEGCQLSVDNSIIPNPNLHRLSADAAIIVLPTTRHYRKTALQLVNSSDTVVEIGASHGETLRLVAKVARRCIGCERARHLVEECHMRYPELDCRHTTDGGDPAELPDVDPVDVLMVDIGGSEAIDRILRCVKAGQTRWRSLRLVLVKSLELEKMRRRFVLNLEDFATKKSDSLFAHNARAIASSNEKPRPRARRRGAYAKALGVAATAVLEAVSARLEIPINWHTDQCSTPPKHPGKRRQNMVRSRMIPEEAFFVQPAVLVQAGSDKLIFVAELKAAAGPEAGLSTDVVTDISRSLNSVMVLPKRSDFEGRPDSADAFFQLGLLTPWSMPSETWTVVVVYKPSHMHAAHAQPVLVEIALGTYAAFGKMEDFLCTLRDSNDLLILGNEAQSINFNS